MFGMLIVGFLSYVAAHFFVGLTADDEDDEVCQDLAPPSGSPFPPLIRVYSGFLELLEGLFSFGFMVYGFGKLRGAICARKKPGGI